IRDGHVTGVQTCALPISTGALAEWLAAARIPLIADVDTRQITRHIRSKGAMRGAVAIGEQPNDAVRTALGASPSMDGLDLATERSEERRVGEECRARRAR